MNGFASTQLLPAGPTTTCHLKLVELEYERMPTPFVCCWHSPSTRWRTLAINTAIGNR